ncbi:MAG: hypothetical protein RL398_3057 [Planctomycetota bacterium]
MRRVRPSFAPLLLAAWSAACAAPAPNSALRWDLQEGRSLTLHTHERPVWSFVFAADADKPHFHPLALPGGASLTVDAPADHRWHHGLWFSWKFVNGVNYWEHAGKTGRSAGRTAWTVESLRTHEDGRAELALRVAYGPEGQPLLQEQRQLSIGAPAESGSYAIDWDATFVATVPCELDRTPLPGEPGGQAFGGYAGLSVRLAQLDDRDALTTTAPVAFNAQDRFRGTADAFDYRGVLDGREVGIAVLSHRDNPRSPSPWYAIRSRDMSFFTPAPLVPGKWLLEQGESLRLRYRIVVHPGRWSPDQLAAAHAEYQAAKP